MKRTILKRISIILAMCSIFSLAACTKEEPETTTTLPEGTSQEQPSETQAAETTSEEATLPAGATTTAQNTTQAAAKKPETKEEIAKYYAAAVNKVKTSAKSISKVYVNNTNYQSIVEIGNNDAISSIAQSLMGQFLKEDTTKVTYSTPADYVAHFPPNKSATCNLAAGMIDTAECKDLGSEYEITIKMNSSMSSPDVDPPFGGGKVGTTFNIVDVDQVTGAAGSMVSLEGMKNSYFDASLTCKIDKATGNMTYLDQTLPSTMEFAKVTAAVIIKVNNAKLGLQYQEKWEVEW
ncbi:MAG: hypothetical protein LBS36_11020 [Oscillospiraceae bacterium]|jgi:hypothetical protein|nr:hypothetical protein [Oscillospiraceae bacterium]